MATTVCEFCHQPKSKKNIARHRKSCPQNPANQQNFVNNDNAHVAAVAPPFPVVHYNPNVLNPAHVANPAPKVALQAPRPQLVIVPAPQSVNDNNLQNRLEQLHLNINHQHGQPNNPFMVQNAANQLNQPDNNNAPNAEQEFLNNYVQIPIDILEGMYPTGMFEEIVDQKATILRRPVAEQLIAKIDTVQQQFAFNRQFSHRGYLLRGPGGTGKSTTLYRVAAHAKQSGWKVVYLPKFSSYCGVLPEELSYTTIMQQFARSGLKELPEFQEIFNNNSFPNIGNKLEALLTQLCVAQTAQPVLLAIDEWNACLKPGVGKIIQQWFAQIFRIPMTTVHVVCAVSATWGGLLLDDKPLFQNADKQDLLWEVPRYSPTELERQYQFLVHTDRLPQLSPNEKQMVLDEASELPRFLAFAAKSSRSNPQFQSWFPHYVGCIGDYYTKVLSTLMNKEQSPVLLDAAVRILLHKEVSETALSATDWETSGLFVPVGGNLMEPICPGAARVLARCFYMENTSDLVLDTLIQKSYGPTALELAITRILCNPNGINIMIPRLNLAEEPSRPPADIQIHTNGKVEKENCTSFPPGSVAALCGNYPVVDWVVHTVEGVLLFIQASLSPYGKHKSKIQHLFKSDGGNLSVAQIWCQRAKKTMFDGVVYIYVTPSSSKSRVSAENREVVRVGPQQLAILVGDDTCRKLLSLVRD